MADIVLLSNLLPLGQLHCPSGGYLFVFSSAQNNVSPYHCLSKPLIAIN